MTPRRLERLLVAGDFLLALLVLLPVPGGAGCFGHGRADTGGKSAHGFRKTASGVCDEKADRRSVCAAAKAMIELLCRADRERRGLFCVKRTEPQEVGSALFELHVSPDDV